MSKDMMSKIRAGDVWREFQKVFREYRIDEARDVSVVDKRPHPVLSVSYCGLTQTMTFSGTPSSRWTCKQEADKLRKLIKGMQLAAVAPLPPAPVERPAIKVIQFRGVDIDTVLHNGEPYVALKPIVEGMGLDWDGQRQRLMRKQAVAERAVVIPVHSAVRGMQETTCIPLDVLNGFLFGIDENRVLPHLKEGVVAYQRECQSALARYWLHGVAVRGEVIPAPAQEQQAGISRDDLHTIGGVVKGIVVKQVGELRTEIVEMLAAMRAPVAPVVAADSVLVRDFVTAQAVIVEMAHVPAEMRYHGLSSWVAKSLQQFSARNGHPVKRIETYPGEKLAFEMRAAGLWLSHAGGRTEIWRRCVARRPQSNGPLFDRGAI